MMGKKSNKQRGENALPPSRGSGLEEYYADPPMTPQEAQEEREEIYAYDLSFEERIQSCLQRFRARRRLRGNATRYFGEYLFLGGIDVNPAPFSGNDPRDLKGLSSQEKHDATATDTLGGNEDRFYTGDKDNWSVDFAGVAAGFFSCMSPITGNEPEETDIAIGVVENFLRYVLHHDVCPEYEDNVKRALQICADAREEIPMLLRFEKTLPGNFNLAAAMFANIFEEHDWSMPRGKHPCREFRQRSPRLTLLTMLSLSVSGETEMLRSLSKDEDWISRIFECTVEVTEIQHPPPEVTKLFKSLHTGKRGAIRLDPVGIVKVKNAIIEDEWMGTSRRWTVHNIDQMHLYFDASVLENMKVGWKMSLTICELDNGLKFVKTLHAAKPTYYTFLPQQMMRHFKGPRESQRPAPSIHGPDENTEGNTAQDE